MHCSGTQSQAVKSAGAPTRRQLKLQCHGLPNSSTVAVHLCGSGSHEASPIELIRHLSSSISTNCRPISDKLLWLLGISSNGFNFMKLHSVDSCPKSAPNDPRELKVDSLNDVRMINRVRQLLTRREIPYALASCTLTAFWVILLIFGAVKEGIRIYDGGSDKPTVFILGGLFVYMSFCLWKQGRGTGGMFAAARRSLDEPVPDAVPGVSLGPSELALGQRSISWRFQHSYDEIHLGAFYKTWRKENFLFLQSDLVQCHYLGLPERTKEWFKELRVRHKAADKAGWTLPQAGEDWQHFDLDLEVVKAQDERGQTEKPQTGSLVAIAFSLLGTGITAAFLINGFLRVQQINAAQLAFMAVAAVVLGYLLIVQIRIARVAWQRRRHGVGILDRYWPGLTHGSTVYRVAETGVELHRKYLKRTITWDAVTSADQRDGLISLQAGNGVLAILPDTEGLRQALLRNGLKPADGPWQRAEGPHSWARAA